MLRAAVSYNPFLQREALQQVPSVDQFDDEVDEADFKAARRENSLAIDALDALGFTGVQALNQTESNTMSNAVPGTLGASGLPKVMNVNDGFSPVTPITNPLPDDDDDESEEENEEDIMKEIECAQQNKIGNERRDEESNIDSELTIMKLPDWAENDDTAISAMCRRRSEMPSSSSFYKRQEREELMGKPNRFESPLRKAGILEFPCAPVVALADVCCMLSRTYGSAAIVKDTEDEVRMRLSLVLKAVTVIITVEDRVVCSRICLRLGFGDTFRVSGDDFDKFCSDIFLRLLHERQVVRPYYS